jgi:hypothetical protein
VRQAETSAPLCPLRLECRAFGSSIAVVCCCSGVSRASVHVLSQREWRLGSPCQSTLCETQSSHHITSHPSCIATFRDHVPTTRERGSEGQYSAAPGQNGHSKSQASQSCRRFCSVPDSFSHVFNAVLCFSAMLLCNRSHPTAASCTR